jgi:FkbM family methyltransferase
MSNVKKIFNIMAAIFAKSYLLTQLSRRVVQIYDNDQNADLKTNGELKVLTYLANKSDEKSIFVDVGSNIGDYSIELIKAGITGKLFLVDPLAKNLSIAKQRIFNENFKNFELMQCALSDSEGKQSFFTSIDESLSGHDSLYDMHSIGYSEETREIEIDVKKFDDIFTEIQIEKVHFLKIDVEGNELNVLKGASKYLASGSIGYIQFEFGNAAKAARVYLHDIVDFLKSMKYTIYIVKPAGLEHLEFNPFTERRYSYINFLPVHADFIDTTAEITISS